MKSQIGMFAQLLVAATFVACTGNQAPAPDAGTSSPNAHLTVVPDAETLKTQEYGYFGMYQPLPDWSGWCFAANDTKSCRAALYKDVHVNKDRNAVRRHGWQLWAAIGAPMETAGTNDGSYTNYGGTKGCWAREGKMCSGSYPRWLTWPNNGQPKQKQTVALANSEGIAQVRSITLLESSRRLAAPAPALNSPDPTKTSTVNPPAPKYDLPWTCDGTDNSPRCAHVKTDKDGVSVDDGTAFVNEGNIMIATESLNEEAYKHIVDNNLYKSDTLSRAYGGKEPKEPYSQPAEYVSTKHIFWPVKGCSPDQSDKAGCKIRYGALPVWIPARYKDKNYASNAEYIGYEMWSADVQHTSGMVAIDTQCQKEPCAETSAAVSLAMYKVKQHDDKTAFGPLKSDNARVFSVNSFRHVQISAEVLSGHFTATDRALLDQSMYWAYGPESNGFEAGDFLVTIAMHVNTKEIDSWTFQSVWWSPMSGEAPDDCRVDDYMNCFGQVAAYSAKADVARGAMAIEDKQQLDIKTPDAWEHYLMTDSYGIPKEIDGAQVVAKNYFGPKVPDWASGPRLPVSMNPYIEPVIHPLGTNCQNCHRRAGFPNGSCKDYSRGCGLGGYQIAQCADLLGDYGSQCNQPRDDFRDGANHCVAKGAKQCEDNGDAFPLLKTDQVWLVADKHWYQPH